jgi:alpha-1,2-mannosyltransferase
MSTEQANLRRRTISVTWGLVLFLVLNGLVLNGVLWLASPPGYNETVLEHSRDVLRGQGGDDSWGVMHVALNHIHASPGVPVYSELFFNRQWRFQYPPSSLFALEALRLAGPDRVRIQDGMVYEGWPPINDLLGWLFLLMTAGATAFLLERYLRRDHLVDDSRSMTAVRVLAVAGLTLTFYPVVKGYTLGQIQVWINGMFALALVCWAVERKALAGFLMGIVCLIKPQYGLFVLWGLLRLEWRFVGAGLATAGLGLVASVMAYGWANHADYLRVLSFLSQHGEAYYPNQTLNGLLNRLMSVNNPDLYINLQLPAGKFPPFNPWIYGATLAVSLALLAAAILRRSDVTDRAWDFSRMAISCTMASPIAWEHHYGVLLPVFALVFASAVGNRPRLIWLAVSYVLISNYVQAANVLAPTFLNPLQSYLLAGAVILLVILHRGPQRDASTHAAPSLMAGPPGSPSLPRAAA